MQIEQVTWKSNVPTKGIDARKAHNALEEIRKKSGALTDDLVVDAARAKNHVLHPWFEWDDTKAAVEFRRSQSRTLIRSIEVVYVEAPEHKARAYEVFKKTRTQDADRTLYSTTEEVLRDPDARDRLIASAIRDAMAFRRRYAMISGFERVLEEIDKAVQEIGLAEAY